MITKEIIFDPRHFNCSSARVVAIPAALGEVQDAEACIVEFESEKAIFEISMPTAGRLSVIHVEVGQLVTSTMVVATIEVDSIEVDVVARPSDSQLSSLKAVYPSVSRFNTYSDAVNNLEERLSIRTTASSDVEELVFVWRHGVAKAIGNPAMIIDANEAQKSWFLGQINLPHKRFESAFLLNNETGEDEFNGFSHIELVQRHPNRSIAIIGVYVANPLASWTPSVRLMESAHDWLRKKGICQVLAMTDPDNISAIRLLKSLEYERSGILPGIHQDDELEIYSLTFNWPGIA